ncbi:hypothetical protein D3C75_1062020 [compost metagenome]
MLGWVLLKAATVAFQLPWGSVYQAWTLMVTGAAAEPPGAAEPPAAGVSASPPPQPARAAVAASVPVSTSRLLFTKDGFLMFDPSNNG